MKFNLKSVTATLLAAAMATSFAGCAGTPDTSSGTGGNAPAAGEPITVSYASYMVGAHVSAKAEKQVIDEFNALHEGKIKVVVEELPSDDAYVQKMKTLAASKALPDVIDGKQGLRELAIKNGQAMDLIPLLEADPEWKKYVGDGAINYNIDTEGKLYSIANAKQIIGYFYNKELFKKAGVTPAKTWDEFMANCEKLKASGVAPTSMFTGENCWATNLFLAAMIGTQGEAGNKFMNTQHPESYETPEVIKGLTMIQKVLQDYTTPDAVGGIYANAANNFCQEKTAIMANGPWMTPDFADPEKSVAGFNEKVGVAAFPEDGLVEQFEIGFTLCTNGKDPAVQEAALKFYKFRTGKRAQEIFLEQNGALPLTTNVEFSEDFKAANPLIVELVTMSGSNKNDFQNIDNTALSSVIAAFSTNYPDLIYGGITPEEMAKRLTEAVANSK